PATWVRRRPGVPAAQVTPPGLPVREPAESRSLPLLGRAPRGEPGRQLWRCPRSRPAERIAGASGRVEAVTLRPQCPGRSVRPRPPRPRLARLAGPRPPPGSDNHAAAVLRPPPERRTPRSIRATISGAVCARRLLCGEIRVRKGEDPVRRHSAGKPER